MTVIIAMNLVEKQIADEGVYVNTYGKITKNVQLQWSEIPSSVGK